jgi:hypothetical protein
VEGRRRELRLVDRCTQWVEDAGSVGIAVAAFVSSAVLLVVEPFLIVGTIASIQEVVVPSVKAADSIAAGSVFRDQWWWPIGVLGVVVTLRANAWLLRRKEREHDEGARSA